MATVEYPHISLNSDNVPIITGTAIKVVEVVTDHLAWGWDAQEIHRQHADYLSLAQVYSALGYYYDHKEEIDADIARRNRLAEEFEAEHGRGPLTEKLRAMRQTP